MYLTYTERAGVLLEAIEDAESQLNGKLANCGPDAESLLRHVIATAKRHPQWPKQSRRQSRITIDREEWQETQAIEEITEASPSDSETTPSLGEEPAVIPDYRDEAGTDERAEIAVYRDQGVGK